MQLQIKHVSVDEPMRLGETIVRVTNKLLTKDQKKETNWIGAHEKTEFRSKVYIFEVIKGNKSYTTTTLWSCFKTAFLLYQLLPC